MNVSKSLFALAALGLFTALPACAAPQGADDAAASEDALARRRAPTLARGTTQSFSGRFDVNAWGDELRVKFWVSDIDWNALTARWHAAIVEVGGDPRDDVNIPMTITMDSCGPECFTFATGPDGQSRRVGLKFRGVQPPSVDYYDIAATDAYLMEVTGAAATEAGTGSCSLSGCGGSFECKPNVTEAECNVRGNLFAVPRCAHTFEFVEGGSCSR